MCCLLPLWKSQNIHQINKNDEYAAILFILKWILLQTLIYSLFNGNLILVWGGLMNRKLRFKRAKDIRVKPKTNSNFYIKKCTSYPKIFSNYINFFSFSRFILLCKICSKDAQKYLNFYSLKVWAPAIFHVVQSALQASQAS